MAPPRLGRLPPRSDNMDHPPKEMALITSDYGIMRYLRITLP